MKFYIVIPVHNEENTLGLTLESIVSQSYLPNKVIIVDDNSSDGTPEIINNYCAQFEWITSIRHTSSTHHIPGSKVVNAFYKGYEKLDQSYDVICKFDGDIILPKIYLEQINNIFESDPSVGIAGGLAFIKKEDHWVYENISNKNHVRGPFKAYKKACFEAIGGIKPSIGWDTVDTLLARYYKWNVVVDQNLQVKHLKPTGHSYNEHSKYLQGEALFKMRYGFWLTFITALKMAFKRRNLPLFINYIKGYFRAKQSGIDHIVSEDEGRFIRKLRWDGIFEKFK